MPAQKKIVPTKNELLFRLRRHAADALRAAENLIRETEKLRRELQTAIDRAKMEKVRRRLKNV